MGCGRVGSSLAIELEAAGHSVAIIDQAREAFRRLGPDFKGLTVTGVGFDSDTLLEAGIQRADAFAAVSNGDNSVIWASDQIMRRLVPEGSRSEWRDATGTVQLAEMHPHKSWYGKAALLIDQITPARVAFITRLGEALIPNEHTVLQEGDLLHVMVLDSELAATESALSHSPDEAS